MSKAIYVLDTNVVSLLWRMENASEENVSLAIHMRSVAPGQIVLSAVTIAEQMQGMLSLIRRFEKINRDDQAFAVFYDVYQFLRRFTVIEHDAAAHARFLTFPAGVRRTGRADCQVAALAINRDYTVVTANAKHFSQIPHVRFEDWTRPGSV